MRSSLSKHWAGRSRNSPLKQNEPTNATTNENPWLDTNYILGKTQKTGVVRQSPQKLAEARAKRLNAALWKKQNEAESETTMGNPLFSGPNFQKPGANGGLPQNGLFQEINFPKPGANGGSPQNALFQPIKLNTKAGGGGFNF